MALPLLGQLQMSQDDPRTVEQVIQDYIDAHEQDPEAHLGEGESLDNHKKYEVIDHPAGSVVPDKIAGGNIHYPVLFSPLSDFDIVGDVNLYNNVFVGLDANGTPTTLSSIEGSLFLTTQSFWQEGDFILDISFLSLFGYTPYEDLVFGKFTTGFYNKNFNRWNIGLENSTSGLRFFWRMNTGLEYSPYFSSLVFEHFYTFRIFYDRIARKLNFLLNGQISFSVDDYNGFDSNSSFKAELERDGEYDTAVDLFPLEFWGSPRYP